MNISFDTDAYVDAIGGLMTARGVGVRVSGWIPEKLYEKLADGPIAELVIDRYPCNKVPGWNGIEGKIEGSLIVLRRADRHNAEGECFELACKVAIALEDDVAGFGAIDVEGIEREPLPEELEQRVVAYRVSFCQVLVVRQTDAPAEPGPLQNLYLGKAPDIGTGHEDDYDLVLAPRRGVASAELELEGEADS